MTATPQPAICSRGCVDELFVRFEAAPGELNDITVDHGYDRMTLRDDGAELRVEGPGCHAVDAHTVACAFSGEVALRVLAGDGADRVRAKGRPGGPRRTSSGPATTSGRAPGCPAARATTG